jgi:hypothetical protein
MNYEEIKNIIFDIFEEKDINNRPKSKIGDYFILGGWCKGDMEEQKSTNRWLLGRYMKDFNHIDIILELHEEFNYDISYLIENGNPDYTFKENLILECIKSNLNRYPEILIDEVKWCDICKSDKNSDDWVGCENCDNDRF